MLDVYHLDTDSIVAPEDQLNYYLISNPNNASPWDPNSGLPPELYQAPGLFYFTNDEGLNVVTSNPEDAPVMLSEFLTMTSGGAGDDILQAHNIEYEDLDFTNIFANPIQILSGRGGDDLINIESGAFTTYLVVPEMMLSRYVLIVL